MDKSTRGCAVEKDEGGRMKAEGRMVKVKQARLEWITPETFHLTRQPTIESLARDIIHCHEASRSAGQTHLLGAFFAGVGLLKAKALVKPAARGVHGSGADGFLKWKMEAFPSIPASTLSRYQTFASLVFSGKSLNSHSEKLGNGQKDHSELFALGNPEDFAVPTEGAAKNALVARLYEITDGKTVTAFLREQNQIMDRKPGSGLNQPGNERGKRRTKAEILEAELRKEANDTAGDVIDLLARWDKHAMWIFLEDDRTLEKLTTALQVCGQKSHQFLLKKAAAKKAGRR